MKPKAPTLMAAVLPLLDAQTRVVEAHEQLVRFDNIEFDYVDGALRDAMQRIASARSAVQELKRQKLGLVTIAETG